MATGAVMNNAAASPEGLALHLELDLHVFPGLEQR